MLACYHRLLSKYFRYVSLVLQTPVLSAKHVDAIITHDLYLLNYSVFVNLCNTNNNVHFIHKFSFFFAGLNLSLLESSFSNLRAYSRYQDDTKGT